MDSSVVGNLKITPTSPVCWMQNQKRASTHCHVSPAFFARLAAKTSSRLTFAPPNRWASQTVLHWDGLGKTSGSQMNRYLDPPTLVSWLDYPTRIRPLGFLLGTSVLEGSYVQGPGPSELLGHRPSDLEVYVLTSVRPSDLEVPGPYGYMTFAQTFTHFFG